MDQSVAYTASEIIERREKPREIQDETLSGRIVLDAAVFERCTFHRAVLVYSGGTPPRIQNCVFQDVTFEFGGAAGRSLAFLQALSAPSSGLRNVVKASFPKLFGH